MSAKVFNLFSGTQQSDDRISHHYYLVRSPDRSYTTPVRITFRNGNFSNAEVPNKKGELKSGISFWEHVRNFRPLDAQISINEITFNQSLRRLSMEARNSNRAPKGATMPAPSQA